MNRFSPKKHFEIHGIWILSSLLFVFLFCVFIVKGIYNIDHSTLQSDYYIFTHDEVRELQKQINNMSTIHQVVGCDNIPLKKLQPGINAWNKLVF